MDFSGKYVLVTSGARGIGRAIVEGNRFRLSPWFYPQIKSINQRFRTASGPGIIERKTPSGSYNGKGTNVKKEGVKYADVNRQKII